MLLDLYTFTILSFTIHAFLTYCYQTLAQIVESNDHGNSILNAFALGIYNQNELALCTNA